MAKTLPKTSKKVTVIANKKTRTYLFEMIWSALEKLNNDLTSADAEKLTTEELKLLCDILMPLSATIAGVRGKPKKTPRPKARRKG